MPKHDDERYVTYVTQSWKQSEDAMDEVHPIWRELWQLYQNKQDFSKKMDWQSKCFIPKIMMQVEKASGQVKRAVLQTRKLFMFELDDSKEQEEIQALEEEFSQSEDPEAMAQIRAEIKRIKTQIKLRKSRMKLREKQFKRKLNQSSFASVYAEMMKPCTLLGLGIPKVVWSEGLEFEHVDGFDFAISPDFKPSGKGRAPYMIERQELDLAEFRQRAKKGGNTWIQRNVKKVEDDFLKTDKFSEMKTRRGLGDYRNINKKVELKLFWGDVVSKDNKKVEENMFLVVANDKYLVRKFENPFDHRKYPYVPTIPMVYPHRGSHGISLVAPVTKLQYTQNNIVNMVMDNLNFSVNKMYEYNPNDVENPNALRSVYPGKMIAVNTPPGQQAVREVVTSAVKRDSLYLYDLVDREQQEATSITEFNSGLPGKKSKTLGEVELKTAQSMGLFDTIARDLELNSLSPLLEMAYDLCVQFEGWEPREGNYIFVVSGLTIMLMQRELRESIERALGLALQAPQLTQLTEIEQLWKKYLDSHNLSDVFKDPESGGVELNPQQQRNIEEKAGADAKQTVGNMSEGEILRLSDNMNAPGAAAQQQTG
jgi:hypothetical protein